MTKTPKNSRRIPIYRRPITIIIFILLIVVAVAVFLFLKFAQSSQPTEPTIPVSVSSDDQSGSSTLENPPDKAIQFEGENPNELDELTGSITRRSISSGELTVVVSIDQYLSSDSSCRLTLKDASGTEIRSTDPLSVEAEATSSVCGPFIVPVGQLSGDYTIDITITSPDKSGHIITEINI